MDLGEERKREVIEEKVEEDKEYKVEIKEELVVKKPKGNNRVAEEEVVKENEAQMLKYAKFLKDLLSNKSKLEELSNVELNANCLAIVLNKMPEKMGDLGPFTLSCGLNNNTVKQALVDLGASINMMPSEDMLVRIGKFIFLADFVILDMDKDVQVPIILGRPFLITSKALIDVFDKKVTLRVGDESMVFYLSESMKHPKESDDTLCYVEGFENIFENENFKKLKQHDA
ncbi:reverse transcriptase domain-containing protein [Tanacetum coccineum]